MKRYFLFFFLILAGCNYSQNTSFDKYESKSAEYIYKLAKKLQIEGDTKKATEAYAALRAFHPESNLVGKSLMESLAANQAEKNYEEVIVLSDRMINWYPGSNLAELGYFSKGNALLNMHRTWLQRKMHVSVFDLSEERLIKAKNCFENILYNFPKSKFKKQAKNKLAEINLNLAKHELHIADFYYKHGNFSAAINRANSAANINKAIKNTNAYKIIMSESGRGAAW